MSAKRVPIDFRLIAARIPPFMVLERIGWVWTTRENAGWHGPCPIHRSQSSRSRSFQCGRKGFRCFVCGEHGNSIRLYSLLSGLAHYESAVAMCDEFGMEIPVLARGERR